MEKTDVLYAVVGAPVTAAKNLSARADEIRAEIEKRTGTLSESAQRRIDAWATEGRQVVSRVTDGKVVDELASKVDLDQAREQVSKLRDQLEDMLATWRSSFRPADGDTSPAGEMNQASEAPPAPSASKPPASKPAEKKTPAKRAPASKTPAGKAKDTTAKKDTGTKNSSGTKTS